MRQPVNKCVSFSQPEQHLCCKVAEKPSAVQDHPDLRVMSTYWWCLLTVAQQQQQQRSAFSHLIFFFFTSGSHSVVTQKTLWGQCRCYRILLANTWSETSLYLLINQLSDKNEVKHSEMNKLTLNTYWNPQRRTCTQGWLSLFLGLVLLEVDWVCTVS